MKAVAKFKNLLEKKKARESDQTSGKDDREPQSTGSSESARQRLGSKDIHNRPTAEGSLAADGSYRDVAATTSSSVVPTPVSGHGSPIPRSQATSSRNNSERSNSGDSRHKRPQRILTASSDKSHAHDPSLDEPLYLGIGAGKDDSLETSDSLDVPDAEVIAESPQAAEFSIYDVAYKMEVERIRQAQGHNAKVYSNKRVEGDQEYKADDNAVHAPSRWAHILNRVREKDEHGNDVPSGT
jgi:[calcium/calmodulin-dependent protein kinase] kinase